MIIYKDLISGDELMSDTYDLKDIDDIAYEVDCQMITKGIDSIDTGANASAEGMDADEGAEDAPAQVNNVIDGFRLQSVPPFKDKKDFAQTLKKYIAKVSEVMKERGDDEAKIKAFDAGVKKYAMDKIVPKLKDFEPYMGETVPDGGFHETMIVYLNYREDDTPYFTIWKHGLTEMKV